MAGNSAPRPRSACGAGTRPVRLMAGRLVAVASAGSGGGVANSGRGRHVRPRPSPGRYVTKHKHEHQQKLGRRSSWRWRCEQCTQRTTSRFPTCWASHRGRRRSSVSPTHRSIRSAASDGPSHGMSGAGGRRSDGKRGRAGDSPRPSRPHRPRPRHLPPRPVVGGEAVSGDVEERATIDGVWPSGVVVDGTVRGLELHSNWLVKVWVDVGLSSDVRCEIRPKRLTWDLLTSLSPGSKCLLVLVDGGWVLRWGVRP